MRQMIVQRFYNKKQNTIINILLYEFLLSFITLNFLLSCTELHAQIRFRFIYKKRTTNKPTTNDQILNAPVLFKST